MAIAKSAWRGEDVRLEYQTILSLGASWTSSARQGCTKHIARHATEVLPQRRYSASTLSSMRRYRLNYDAEQDVETAS